MYTDTHERHTKWREIVMEMEQNRQFTFNCFERIRGLSTGSLRVSHVKGAQVISHYKVSHMSAIQKRVFIYFCL